MYKNNKNKIGCIKPIVRGTCSSENIVIIKKKNIEYIAIASKSFMILYLLKDLDIFL